MEYEGSYRLFGELYLEDPSSDELLVRKLERLRPYFTELEHRCVHKTSEWQVRPAFNMAARAEIACWEAHGQTRDISFLIPPDGPLEATLACHLHNPNFNVSDPYSQQGADESNASISQIMSAGFTPDKVLIYDHTFRREPVDPLAVYPPDALKIHEDFTDMLRKNMSAVVDVVWGACVRNRMKKTHRLEEFPLWGQYQGTSVYLEWGKTSSKLQRIVIFVCHPEAMMYNEPKIAGREQDLSLRVAAKLAKISIREGFYENIYQPRHHKFLSGEERTRRAKLNSEAFRQLESIAYQNTPQISNWRQKRNTTPFNERKKLEQYPGIYRYFCTKAVTDEGMEADSAGDEGDDDLVRLDKEINISVNGESHGEVSMSNVL